jgi:hypothetical protein
LNEYHSPHKSLIRKTSAEGGTDPKDMPELQKLRNKLRLTRPLKDYVKYMNTPGSSMFESILDCGVGDVDGDRKNKDERSMKLLN